MTLTAGYLAFCGASLRSILRHAAFAFDVDEADLTGRRGPVHLSLYRHVTAATMRQFGYSYPAIGRILARDHKTVMHSCELVNRDPDLRGARDRLAIEIRSEAQK